MHWMRPGQFALTRRWLSIVLLMSYELGVMPARADLIRPIPSQSYPEIAGDISGTQTYSFDPATKTGTFEVINFPHVLELGPQTGETIPIHPNPDGTLQQSLRISLDEKGNLVDRPENLFQLHGTVVIGGKTFEGLLLEGRPTSFGARSQSAASDPRKSEAFDLNLKIIDGNLREAFGSEAYLRIVPQSDSTFRGEFTTNFSSDKPLTDLRSTGQRILPASVPEPAAILVFVFGIVMIAVGGALRRVLGLS